VDAVEVGSERPGGRAEVVGELLQGLLAPAGEDHLARSRRELAGDRMPDAPACARDERRRPRYTHRYAPPPQSRWPGNDSSPREIAALGILVSTAEDTNTKERV
jgi:hypothetical protein